MNYTIYDYLGLFFFYAFLWMASGNFCGRDPKKHMVNRGFLNGPLCAIYGITAVFMTRYLYELQSSPVFCSLAVWIIATAVEWLAGHALERIGHGKWWDYSNKKWNMDGYICLQYSVLWGILGLLAMKIGNRLCFTVLHSIPAGFLHITSWILFGILVVDAVGSYAVLHHITKNAADQRYERSDRRLHQTPFCPCLPLSGASCGTCLSGRTASFGEKRENRNRRICRRMQLLQNRSSSSSAHFWAILQKPYSAASPPVSG